MHALVCVAFTLPWLSAYSRGKPGWGSCAWHRAHERCPAALCDLTTPRGIWAFPDDPALCAVQVRGGSAQGRAGPCGGSGSTALLDTFAYQNPNVAIRSPSRKAASSSKGGPPGVRSSNASMTRQTAEQLCICRPGSSYGAFPRKAASSLRGGPQAASTWHASTTPQAAQ